MLRLKKSMVIFFISFKKTEGVTVYRSIVVAVMLIVVRNRKNSTVKPNRNRRPDSKPAIAIIANAISISAERKIC